jgi:predicted small lipoprotein YifL
MHSKRFARTFVQLSALATLACTLAACGEAFPSQAQAYSKVAEDVFIAQGLCADSQDCAK